MKQTVGTYLSVVVLLFIFITGCQEQQEQQINIETPSEKQARLIAIDNAKLKENIQQLNRQLNRQTRKCEDEINGLKVSLKRAQDINNELSNLLKDDSNWLQFEEFTSSVMTTLGQENENLRQEKVDLTAEIERLQKQIEELNEGVEE
ncbi:MAG: hypothetical protein ACYST2_02025 [Planctomycetota bacterium]|jgi:hypothetical protein